MRKLAYIASFFLTVLISAAVAHAQEIVINEVVYANRSVLTDGDGDTPDWIELYNAGTEKVNLKNYILSDDTTRLTPWTFPSFELLPGTYLVVFSSGKNRKNTEEFHTDFKLRVLKESLYLISPVGEIIDKVDAQCIPTDKAFGRKPDGTANKGLLTPTPGESNNQAERVTINYQQDTLIINHPGGLYPDPISIELTNHHPKNTIYFTLDGDDPDDTETVYDSSIYLEDFTPNKNRFANIPETEVGTGDLIFKANVVRAVVYSDGCPASNEISNTYFINEKIKERNTVQFISIITDEDNMFDPDEGIYVRGNHTNYNQRGKAWERDVHLEFFDTSGTQIIDQDAGMRIHGRASRGAPQKSFRFYARDKYGKESFDHPFFEQKPHLTSFKTLLLRSTEDWSGTMFKDELCQHIVEDMNVDYSAATTAIAFVNGEYWGVYSLRERQDEHYIENNHGIENPDLDVISYSPGGLGLEQGNMLAYEELIAWVENADPLSESFYDDANERIDLDAAIDFYITHLFLANPDFPNNNLKMWRHRTDTSRWRFYFFDLDAAMTRPRFDHLSEYNNNIENYQRYPEYSMVIFRKLLQNNEFREKLNLRYLYHLNSSFTADRVIGLIDKYETQYAALVPEHTYRWHQPADYLKWKENVKTLSMFALERPNVASQTLHNNFSNPFKVYPNPSNGVFSLMLSESIEIVYTISIYNLSGQLLFKREYFQDDRTQLIETDLTPGYYLLKMRVKNMVFSETISIL